MNREREELFESGSVLKTIERLALPTVLSQIILVIYNMADTFFISMTHSDANIAAVTVCTPAFMLLSAVANLFGIGGSAVISRALGRRNREKAERAAGFAFFGCLCTAAIYALMVCVLCGPFVDLLGGKDEMVHGAAVRYLLITIGAGGIATAMSSLLSHLVRSEGRAKEAGFGIILGGVLNMLLDPLLMFVILPAGHEVTGAAAATALSNLISALWFAMLLRRIQKEGSVLHFHFDAACLKDGTAREIILNGLPACVMTLMENVSYAVLDALMASAGIAAQSGIGVAKKINMLAHAVVRGIAQGVLPVLAYTYARRDYARLKKFITASSSISVGFSLLMTAANICFAPQLAGIYLPQGQSLHYAVSFLRILTIGCPFSAFAYAVISFFQAVNEGKKSFLLALMRKGILDIPMMFFLQKRIPVYGAAIATPAADIICCMASLILLHLFLKNLIYSRQLHEAENRDRDIMNTGNSAYVRS